MNTKRFVSSWNQFAVEATAVVAVLNPKFVRAMEALDENNIQIHAVQVQNNRVYGEVPFVWLEFSNETIGCTIHLLITERHNTIEIYAQTKQGTQIPYFFDESMNAFWFSHNCSVIDVKYEDFIPAIQKSVEIARWTANNDIPALFDRHLAQQ